MCTVKDRGYDCEMRFPLVAGLKYRSISSKLLYLSTQVQAHMRDTGRIILLYMISRLFYLSFDAPASTRVNASLIAFSTTTTFTLNSPLSSLLPFELLLLLNLPLPLTVQPLILCAQLFLPVLTLCSTPTSTKYTSLANPTLPTAGREG